MKNRDYVIFIGFKGVWGSGLSVSAQLGVRDSNEASWTQVVEVLEFMSDATDIPILLDADTGYGNFNNARRLVRKLEDRGIAGTKIIFIFYTSKCKKYFFKSIYRAAQTENAKSMSYQGLSQRGINERSVCIRGRSAKQHGHDGQNAMSSRVHHGL